MGRLARTAIVPFVLFAQIAITVTSCTLLSSRDGPSSPLRLIVRGSAPAEPQFPPPPDASRLPATLRLAAIGVQGYDTSRPATALRTTSRIKTDDARAALGAGDGAVATALKRLALVLSASNATVCPAGLSRIRALPGWDGDLNSGAHVPAAWAPQCGAALESACGFTKAPAGGNESCVACLQANSAELLAANCTQDSAVAWCSQTFAGSFAHICAGGGDTAAAGIADLCAFTTPSDADPDGDCPRGWEKIESESSAHNLNTGSTNIGAGYLCMQRASSERGAARGPVLVGLEGGLMAKGCPADASAVPACAGSPSPGPVDFDPSGAGALLCMRRG
jgi:hypothetical protein